VIPQDAKRVRWWEEEEPAARAHACAAGLHWLESQDQTRLNDYRRFEQLYENRDSTDRRSKRAPGSILNGIKMAIDTIASRIAHSRPHGRAQTFGANRSNRKKAMLQERWVEAEQYRSGLERHSGKVFVDACRFGTGIFKHRLEGTHIETDRVHPREVFVDVIPGSDRKPKTYFHRVVLPRAQVIADYPEHEEAIRQAPAPLFTDSPGNEPLADVVEVIESWHVAHGDTPGQRILACGDAELSAPAPGDEYEQWPYEDPPLAFFHWAEPSTGFWGYGLAEELLTLHVDINISLAQVQKNIPYGNFQVWLSSLASRTKPGRMNNAAGAINHYHGSPPVFHTIEPVSQSLMAHVELQFQRLMAQAGVSLDSAAAKNTLGADASGHARRLFHEVETMRYALVERAWQWFWMDNYHQYLRLGKLAADINGGDFDVVASRDKHTLRTVKWSDLDLDKDSYVIRVAPVSALPYLPSDRIAYVSDLVAMGVEDDKKKVKRLLGMPDLESEYDLENAGTDNIERQIEAMVDEGRPVQPTPFQDPLEAIRVATAWHELTADMEDVPEDHRELLREYIAGAVKMQEKAAMAALQAQQAMAGVQTPAEGAAAPMEPQMQPEGTLQ